MKFPIQDSETGETGCIVEELHTKQFNEETGEPENETLKIRYHKTKFNIPKKYLEDNHTCEKEKRGFLENYPEMFTLTDANKVIHLKEEIILGYNKTSHRMFLIPSLFFFTKLTAVFISISEIFLHVWAHRKNSKNTNPNIYYRSPLHVLTAQFCAVCRAETERDHIYRLQNRSRRLHPSLKDVTRTLS